MKNFLWKLNLSVAVLGFLKGALKAVPALVGGIILLSLIDRFLQIPLWGRQVLWTFGFLSALGLLLSGFLPFDLFTLKEKSKNLIENSRRKRADTLLRWDDLWIAFHFSKGAGDAHTSQELRSAFVESVTYRLGSLSPLWCFPSWIWRRAAMMAMSSLLLGGVLHLLSPDIFTLNSRILFPFAGTEIDRGVTVSPGDIDVPWGTDVEILVGLKEKSFIRPALYVKSGQGWIAYHSEKETLNSWSYMIRDVVEPLTYRVEWKGEWSRRYLILPVEPVRIRKFNISVQPPDYIGQERQSQNHPEVRGLSGSSVEMEIESTADFQQARLIFSDKREKDADSIRGRIARFSFVLDKPGTYSFELKDAKGNVLPLSENYPLHILADNPPTIQLLSPEQDLVIGSREKIPVTFDARDDFGVSDIYLRFETQRGRKDRVLIRRFDKKNPSLIETYTWDLAARSFESRDVVRFAVEAVDGNVVTGPGVGISDWRILELTSFEEEHEHLEKALEEWRDKAVELLAQVNTLKAKAEDDAIPMENLEPQFNPAAQLSQGLEKYLDQIVKRMEEDPLVDYGVMMEHKAMKDNMKALNENTVKNAQSTFQTKNRDALESNLDTMSAELERMVALSENLSKAQKARDMREASEKLEELGEDLLKKLENGEQNPELMNQIKDILNEAQKNLMEMAQSMKNMPEELPEDFVNQQALKDLKMQESSDMLSRINEAIKKGDMKGALAMAKQFLAAAQQMRKQLEEAHESFLESNSAEDLEDKIAKHEQELNEIVEEQRKLLAETQKLESQRMQKMMQMQENLLKELAKKQHALVIKTTELTNKKEILATVGVLVNGQLKVMRDIEAEFNALRLDKSILWLDSVVTAMATAETEQSKSTATASMAGAIGEIKNSEKEILDELKKPLPNPPLGSGEGPAFQELSKRQSGLNQRAQGLKKDLQALSQRTANVGLPLSQSLSRAGNEMKGASDSLRENQSRSAQSHEEKALQSLAESQQNLQQARQTLGEMSSNSSGGGGSGPRVVVRSGQSGQSGSKQGKVRLPKAEDYKPPKEFREDLLESLKENYPKIYEDIIQKYFKRLSE